MHVTIYSDGSARGNPNGPGGYGAVIQYVDSRGILHEKELSEGFNPTTNNRMELLGAIAGLEALNRPCTVDLYSDSSYLVNAFAQHWLESWQKRGWVTSAREPVKNTDLWKRLIRAADPHDITWHWVRGHAGNAMNERCDRLATAAADSMYGRSRPNQDPMGK